MCCGYIEGPVNLVHDFLKLLFLCFQTPISFVHNAWFGIPYRNEVCITLYARQTSYSNCLFIEIAVTSIKSFRNAIHVN